MWEERRWAGSLFCLISFLTVFPTSFPLRVSGKGISLLVSLGFILHSLPCVGCVTLCDCVASIQAKQSMQNETTIMGLCANIPVGTLSVHCVTCHGPNKYPVGCAQDFVFTAAQYSSILQHAVCSLLTNEQTQASTRGGTTFCSTPRLLDTGTLQCHLHNPTLLPTSYYLPW